MRTWKKTVRQIATECWSSEQTPATGFVMLQLTYFYDSVEPDIDNIVKLIQDAIIVFAYADDDASLSE